MSGYARFYVETDFNRAARANPTYEMTTNATLSRAAAILLFAVVVFSWGITWPVTKAIVAEVPPLWASAIRSVIAGVALLGLSCIAPAT